MQSGVVLIDKDSGLSSAHVVSRIKRMLKLDKIGHAGTLDPAATGLLVCLTGRATRLANLVEGGNKVYSGIIRLGISTSTDDLEGEILNQQEVILDDSKIEQAIQKLTGEINQTPPAVSAIKVNGRRAYDIARSGQVVELSARKVTVAEFIFQRESATDIRYRIRCSKGTYIRSLARDLGQILGCGAATASIRREESVPFSVNNAVKLDSLTIDDIQPWELIFAGFPNIIINEHDMAYFARGDLQYVQRVMHVKEQQLNKDEIDLKFAQDFRSGVPSHIIYREEATNRAVGILKRAPTGWAIGVHIG